MTKAPDADDEPYKEFCLYVLKISAVYYKMKAEKKNLAIKGGICHERIY